MYLKLEEKIDATPGYDGMCPIRNANIWPCCSIWVDSNQMKNKSNQT